MNKWHVILSAHMKYVNYYAISKYEFIYDATA